MLAIALTATLILLPNGLGNTGCLDTQTIRNVSGPLFGTIVLGIRATLLVAGPTNLYKGQGRYGTVED